jgi:hypothetical protein
MQLSKLKGRIAAKIESTLEQALKGKHTNAQPHGFSRPAVPSALSSRPPKPNGALSGQAGMANLPPRLGNPQHMQPFPGLAGQPSHMAAQHGLQQQAFVGVPVMPQQFAPHQAAISQRPQFASPQHPFRHPSPHLAQHPGLQPSAMHRPAVAPQQTFAPPTGAAFLQQSPLLNMPLPNAPRPQRPMQHPGPQPSAMHRPAVAPQQTFAPPTGAAFLQQSPLLNVAIPNANTNAATSATPSAQTASMNLAAATLQKPSLSKPSAVNGAAAVQAPQSMAVKFKDTQPMNSHYKGEETGKVFGTQVKYLSHAERQAYKVTIHNGRMYGADGKPFDTSKATTAFANNKGRAIFVMDHRGNIYVSNEQTRGKFHHSSFLAGAPVAAAGDIRVENGVIKAISRKSGHYRPTENQLNQVLWELHGRGAPPVAVDHGLS